MSNHNGERTAHDLTSEELAGFIAELGPVARALEDHILRPDDATKIHAVMDRVVEIIEARGDLVVLEDIADPELPLYEAPEVQTTPTGTRTLYDSGVGITTHLTRQL